EELLHVRGRRSVAEGRRSKCGADCRTVDIIKLDVCSRYCALLNWRFSLARSQSNSIMDSMKELLNAEPFVPFQIMATNGRHYDVRDPFSIAINRSQVFYCFPKSDRVAHIRIQEIVSLETLQAA